MVQPYLHILRVHEAQCGDGEIAGRDVTAGEGGGDQ
jgi:hypothetical protein